MKRIVLLMLATCSIQIVIYSQQVAYKNKNLSPEVRAKDLLGRMTLDEKVMQTQCLWIQKSQILDANGEFDEAKAEKNVRNGLGELARLNENAGPNSYGLHPKQAAELYNRIQHFFIEKTRLGIPVMVHEESLHGQQTQDATNFPVPIALASTWDENLLTDIYTQVAKEVRARGGQQVLAPVVDVVRDPRWGRTEETMGEDPYLISRLAIAEVRAYQGSGTYLTKDHVAATLKHFGIHGQSEGGINVSPSNIDERTAREIFFKPFQSCVKEAHAMNVMATYNEIWGIPAHINKYLLTDILRKEWGFNGVIVSDYFAIRDVSTLHRITPSYDTAGLLAFKAGIDIETPDPDGFKNLKQLVVAGKISMKELDQSVMKILINKFRLGLFDDPYVDPDKAEEIVGNKDSRAIAYKAATEAMVLMKNQNNFLPLDKNKIRTIAFIGPNADKCLLGGYSSKPRVCISPLQALKEKYGNSMNILYAEGVKITDKNNWFADTIRLADPEENKKKIAQAVEVAKQADVIVLFVGGNESTNREGWAIDHLGDLPTLDLLNGQNELIKQVTALGKPTCAFINSGPPLSIGNLVESVPAVMQCWYLGQEGGYAVVDALFGDVNPGGKLPISFPRSAGNIPVYYNYKPSARRGYNLGFDVSPLYAFGHGLSYTTFAYSDVKLSSSTIKSTGSVVLSVSVKNTGSRRGSEVVQMYIRDDYSSVTRPVKELKGFKKIWLDPGQSETVNFTITPGQLSFYNKDMEWTLEPGDFTIMVGTASDETQSVKLTVVR
ncbi:MAG TPA: glycoside hydrolase family 3 N-terminal domain-containing protein [Chitinophagaceae bacterium]